MYQYNTKQTLKFLEKDFDFAVSNQEYGDYGKIILQRKDFDVKKHCFLFKNQHKNVIENLKKIDFEKHSRGNTMISGNSGFRKHDVVIE